MLKLVIEIGATVTIGKIFKEYVMIQPQNSNTRNVCY